MSDDAQTVGQENSANDWVVAPIPISNPAIETGVALAGLYISHPEPQSEPWLSGAAVMYTTNDSWAVAGFHSMSLKQDKFRSLAVVGYADLNLDFYGIGSDAGDRNTAVAISDRGALAILQGQMRMLFRHLYIGPKYRFQNIRSRLRTQNPPFPDLNLPAFQLRSQISSLGPLMTYDSRDSTLNPRKGVLITVDLGFVNDIFGSDFNYTTFNLAANLYAPLGKDTVLVFRKTMCAVGDGAPYYDLCLYGKGADMRGYEPGQYRDRGAWTLQGEIRQHVKGRFGAVVFGGIGGIAPELGKFNHTKMLPSAGAGVRYLASEANNVNLRLDVAFGKHSHAVYFGIGEAF